MRTEVNHNTVREWNDLFLMELLKIIGFPLLASKANYSRKQLIKNGKALDDNMIGCMNVNVATKVYVSMIIYDGSL